MLVFVHIPKTAGTSFKNILRANYGRRHIDSIKSKHFPFTTADFEFAKRVFKSPAAISGHNLVNATEQLAIPGIKYLCFLRQPLERCASHYQDLVTRNGLKLSFKEWISKVENQDLMVQTIAGSKDLEKAREYLEKRFSFCGISEYFEESLLLFEKTLDPTLDLHYVKRNVSGDKSISSTLLEKGENRKLLEKHNRLDIELYDFALNRLFIPRMKQHGIVPGEPTFMVNSLDPDMEKRRQQGIRFNKLVYRPLVKLFKSPGQIEGTAI